LRGNAAHCRPERARSPQRKTFCLINNAEPDSEPCAGRLLAVRCTAVAMSRFQTCSGGGLMEPLRFRNVSNAGSCGREAQTVLLNPFHVCRGRPALVRTLRGRWRPYALNAIKND